MILYSFICLLTFVVLLAALYLCFSSPLVFSTLTWPERYGYCAITCCPWLIYIMSYVYTAYFSYISHLCADAVTMFWWVFICIAIGGEVLRCERQFYSMHVCVHVCVKHVNACVCACEWETVGSDRCQKWKQILHPKTGWPQSFESSDVFFLCNPPPLLITLPLLQTYSVISIPELLSIIWYLSDHKDYKYKQKTCNKLVWC